MFVYIVFPITKNIRFNNNLIYMENIIYHVFIRESRKIGDCPCTQHSIVDMTSYGAYSSRVDLSMLEPGDEPDQFRKYDKELERLADVVVREHMEYIEKRYHIATLLDYDMEIKFSFNKPFDLALCDGVEVRTSKLSKMEQEKFIEAVKRAHAELRRSRVDNIIKSGFMPIR